MVIKFKINGNSKEVLITIDLIINSKNSLK